MNDRHHLGSVSYRETSADYFAKRGLRRYAGKWSLWALGVGAVISGHFSGWNLGLLQGGFGGMLIATVFIMLMYLGLCYSIAEMASAMPHTGGAYSFSRNALGPWGGFVTGLAESIEFILTPAVIVFFLGGYLGGIFETGPQWQPVWWLGAYGVFVLLNLLGVELSFRVSVLVTLLALGVLCVFWFSALPSMDFSKYALNIGLDSEGATLLLAEGGGVWLPFEWGGVLAAMPFAVWLFLAIEQLPLASEESLNPEQDMPRGLRLGMSTLIISAFMIVVLNSSVAPGAFALGSSGEPLLAGFRGIYGDSIAKVLAVFAVLGLIASFHTIIYAFGRQIYSLSRAGYYPAPFSLTLGKQKTPHLALLVGSATGLGVLLGIWHFAGAEHGPAFIGGTLLNMAVLGAMISYFMQSASFIVLRRTQPQMNRPYISPLGIAGAATTMIIAAITITYQLRDPLYQTGAYLALAWYGAGLLYFALYGRHHLVRSPEEQFALSTR